MATVNQIGLGLSGSTGTGTFVGANTPTLITPVLGAATGTSVVLSGKSTANNMISGFASTVTAGATTTLIVTSPQNQEFTGTLTQTVVMPVTSTMVAGQQFYIINNSSGVVTVQSSGANTIQAMDGSTSLLLTVVNTGVTTAAGWEAAYIADAAGVLSITGTANQIIASASTGAITLSAPQDIATISSPTFAALTLTAALTVPNGGTGIQTTTAYGVITGGTSATGALQNAGAGLAGQFLQSGGAASLPVWTTSTFPAVGGASGNILISNGTNYIASTSLWPNTVGSAGTLLRSNGTSNAYTTSTFADTYGASTLLYSNGANTVTGLATANSAALVTNGSGVPAWQAMSAGQILIGTTSGAPTAAAINSGTNITVANGSGSITVNLSGIISPTLGGTGVNNGSNTLTLSGNLATSGAFSSTFTMTGATSVTFPTSGTLATTASASGIVNSGTINQLTWYAATGTAVSGLATANNGILVTSSGGVPSIGNTVGADLTISSVRVGRGNGSVSTNTCVGSSAMAAVATGGNNIAMGASAMTSLTSGIRNVGLGFQALYSITTTNENVGIGFNALSGSASPTACTAVGTQALLNVSGNNNTGFGYNVGSGISSGSAQLTSGANNTLIGFEADVNNAATIGALAIGSNAVADIATGATSSDNGPGIAIGSAAFPVGFRGDATVYPTAGIGGGTLPLTFTGYVRVKINGTYYKLPLYPDA